MVNDKIFIPRDILEKALKYADKGNCRTGLNGVSLLIDEEGDSTNINIESTDGHRLYRGTISNYYHIKPPGTDEIVLDTFKNSSGRRVYIDATQTIELKSKLEEVRAIMRLSNQRQRKSILLKVHLLKNGRIFLQSDNKCISRYIQATNMPVKVMGIMFYINVEYLWQTIQEEDFSKYGFEIMMPKADKPSGEILSSIGFKPYRKPCPLHILMPMRK